MNQSIIIPGRFNGPVASGNGGYVCGVVAELIEGDAEVTLRAPPPLEIPMRVEHDEQGSIEVLEGKTLVATGRPIIFDAPRIPVAPTWDEAVAASRHYLGHQRHEFSTCFSCGPDRNDGLGIFPGPTDGGPVAAPWKPDAGLPNAAGILAAPIVWAALDCPGAWATIRSVTDDQVVLGRMAAVASTPIEIGQRYVAMAWTLGQEGRKAFAATALIDEAGTTVATARQTWIALA